MKQNRFWKRTVVFAAAAFMAVAGTVTVWASTENSQDKLETIGDNYWDEDDVTIARWDEIENAGRYEVTLYRNNKKIGTIKTKRKYYDFRRMITREGDYVFRVRPLGKSSSYEDGEWSEYSLENYISKDYAELLKSGKDIDDVNSGPGAQGVERPLTDDIGVVYTAKWIPEGDRWRYQKSDGTYQGAGWLWDPAAQLWYYFGEDGYMMTGWIEVNGAKYYLQPSGAMVTGQQTIDGVAYQFDASGALIPS